MNVCKNLKIRILAFLMAFWLAFSVSYNDYQEVQALEWAIPTIAFDTALKFLLGLLGVSLTSKALHDNVDWSEVRQNCVDYQIQQGNDAVAVSEWWEDVIHGTLNQASDCWTAFKEWVNQQINPPVMGSTFVSSAINSVNSSLDVSSLTSSELDFTFNVGYYYLYNNGYRFTFFNHAQVDVLSSSSIRIVPLNSSFDYISLNFSSNNSLSYNSNIVNTQSLSLNITGITLFLYGSTLVLPDNVNLWTLSDTSVDSSIFDSANDNIQDTAITTEDTTTTAIPDTLPLPWDNVSDTAEGVDDAISGLQEQVAEGVISLEDYWERVQELVNALVIDTTSEETLPVTQNPDTGENETIQDKVEENISNTGFTLSGLEKVFPFCIPWDIYSFVTLLVAEPQAPVINYPFYNPITDSNVNISIDFSDWETIVVLFRYILDFLLIIGLLLLSRQLAGAGGDD